MEKGTRNYVGLIFSVAHKSAQHTSWHGALNSMVHKLAWAGMQVIQPGF